VHRKQRYAATGHDARPVSFTRQSMQVATASIASEFCRLVVESCPYRFLRLGDCSSHLSGQYIAGLLLFCCVVSAACKVAQGMRACFFWHDCSVSCRMCVACSVSARAMCNV
jgi:hypothetical protein